MKKSIVCQWIVVDDQSRILLIKRKWNKKNLPNYWALPGWNQEIWETNEQTVIREVKEEAGLDFEITTLFMEWEGIGDNYFYRYIWKYSGQITVQDEECDGYGWFSHTETEKLLIHTSMQDTIQRLHDGNLIK
jgi:ADP-ribose pyrophosphatase YjhB (NUDIX family)